MLLRAVMSEKIVANPSSPQGAAEMAKVFPMGGKKASICWGFPVKATAAYSSKKGASPTL